MENHFFAMMSRMKYIERWALMRNAQKENISEHSLEVSMLAHGLAVISNKRLGNSLNAERAALLGLYHDTTEIITGDLPTPIKYANPDIMQAYQELEQVSAHKLLSMLPEDIRCEYESLYFKKEEDTYLWKLVKAADKLSALIKCMEEEKAGNKEFIRAEQTIMLAIKENDLEEVRIFVDEFLPSYSKCLDELK